MKVFLVDYENVHETGLEGIDLLTDADKVIIFHGPIKETVDLSIVKSIVKSKAEFDFIGTKRTADNYLDFQLSTYLGYFINQHPKAEFHIISKDADYDAVIDFWKDNKKLKIHKQPSISGKIKELKNDKSKKIDENNGIAVSVNPELNDNSEQIANNGIEIKSPKTINDIKGMKAELGIVLQKFNISKNKLNKICYIIINNAEKKALHQNLIDTFKDMTNINEVYKEIRKVHLQLRKKYLT